MISKPVAQRKHYSCWMSHILWTHKLFVPIMWSCTVYKLRKSISPDLQLFPLLPPPNPPPPPHPALACADSILLLCWTLFFGLVVRFELQEEVVAGDCEGAHQDDELSEVHLPVVVGVQVVHHLLNRFIIFGVLTAGNSETGEGDFKNVFSVVCPCTCVFVCACGHTSMHKLVGTCVWACECIPSVVCCIFANPIIALVHNHIFVSCTGLTPK